MSKKFYPSEKVKKHYRIVGICSVIAAMIILLITPFGGINNIQKVLFILILIGLPVLYTTRNKRVILTIDQERIYFDDGLLGKVDVPLDMIEYVEYNPQLKFRLKTFKRRKPIVVMNVFSLADQQEILKTIQAKRHRIKIVYLERPDKIVTKEAQKKRK